ncbi:hypothetical protein [Ottowia sp.]|uniref:hypothetical protein n=1 Tax=Ottowia sp. TaxID=1898956 RepID=UPI003A86A478
MTTPIESMRKKAADYAAQRDKLAALVQAMKDEMSTIERGAMPDILRAARRISALHNDLAGQISASPECFDKPRTLVVDGLKFGLQKQKGSITWDSDEQLIKRADGLLDKGVISGDEYGALIRTERRVNAAALALLDGGTLKRLGASVASDTDAVLIKSTDGAVQKMVAAIVREATRDAEAAA